LGISPASNLTPGKYPKEYIQYSNHGESLKSSIWVPSFWIRRILEC